MVHKMLGVIAKNAFTIINLRIKLFYFLFKNDKMNNFNIVTICVDEIDGNDIDAKFKITLEGYSGEVKKLANVSVKKLMQLYEQSNGCEPPYEVQKIFHKQRETEDNEYAW